MGDPGITMRIKILTILMLGFSAISAVLFTAELRVFVAAQASGFDQPRPDAALLGSHLSLRATHETLMFCDRQLSVPLAYLRPKSETLAIAVTCAEIAAKIATKMPTHGFAHFVAALAAHHRENQLLRDTLLETSANFAPFEGWLAERRYSLIMNARDATSVESSSNLANDIATLLTTQSGAELLASYYTLRPESRKLIASVSAAASTPNQTRLSNQLTRKRAGK